MFDLARVGLVGRIEFVDPGIGVLEVDVDHRDLAAEAKPRPHRIGHDVVEYLVRGAAVVDHAGADGHVRDPADPATACRGRRGLAIAHAVVWSDWLVQDGRHRLRKGNGLGGLETVGGGVGTARPEYRGSGREAEQAGDDHGVLLSRR